MIAIIGAGYIGTHFAKVLLTNNLPFITTSREINKNKQFPWVKHSIGENLPQEIQMADSIYILVPPSEELLLGLKKIHPLFKENQKIIYTSSIGIYSDKSRNKALLQSIEEEILKIPNSLILRLGGLIGNERHPAFYLSGKENLEGGLTPINLTHIDDITFFFMHLQKNHISGIYDFVSEGHPLKKDFYPRECKRLGLPSCHFKNEGDPHKIIHSHKLEKAYNIKLSQRF